MAVILSRPQCVNIASDNMLVLHFYLNQYWAKSWHHLEARGYGAWNAKSDAGAMVHDGSFTFPK